MTEKHFISPQNTSLSSYFPSIVQVSSNFAINVNFDKIGRNFFAMTSALKMLTLTTSCLRLYKIEKDFTLTSSQAKGS